MNDKDLEKTINRIRNLKSHKGKSKAELVEAAKEILRKKSLKKQGIKIIEEVDWIGLDEKEIEKANKIYTLYLKNHDFESYSDKEELRNLVQNIVLRDKLQLQIQTKDKSSGKNSKNINSYDTNALKQLDDLIQTQKKNLGLNRKKQGTWKDFWLTLLKRIQLYISTHGGEFYMKCPYDDCNRMIVLRRKIKDYKAFKFSMFRGTHLYNEEMLKDIEAGKLTMEQMARYWGLGNTDYIKGIYEDVYLKEKAEKEKTKELDKKIGEIE